MHFGWITRLVLISFLAVSILLVGAQLFFLWHFERETTITFLNVGQGDAILIQSGHKQILIDGGREGITLLSALGQVMPFYDRAIDVVIATHPDADHIGGFSTLLDRYQVGQFIDTGWSQSKPTDDVLLLERALDRHQVAHSIPGRRGVTLTLQHGGQLMLLYPSNLPLPASLDSNEGSIVARFTFGTTDFLLTGDLPHEEDVLADIEPAEVLKAAHHGSAYSTSDAWLDLVRPSEAILSVGKNTYGHPAPEVLERLQRRGITSLRTDQVGSITYRCFLERQKCLRDT